MTKREYKKWVKKFMKQCKKECKHCDIINVNCCYEDSFCKICVDKWQEKIDKKKNEVLEDGTNS